MLLRRHIRHPWLFGVLFSLKEKKNKNKTTTTKNKKTNGGCDKTFLFGKVTGLILLPITLSSVLHGMGQ